MTKAYLEAQIAALKQEASTYRYACASLELQNRKLKDEVTKLNRAAARNKRAAQEAKKLVPDTVWAQIRKNKRQEYEAKRGSLPANMTRKATTT